MFDKIFEESKKEESIYRISHQMCLTKRLFSKISQNSQENTCARVLFCKVALHNCLSSCNQLFIIAIPKFSYC